MRQVPARTLELPGGPVTPSGLDRLLLPFEPPRAQVVDLGRQLPVHGRSGRGLRRLHGDLTGSLPQDAGNPRTVSFELVSHDALLSLPLSASARSGDTKSP